MLEKILDNFKSNIAREKYPYDEENNPESKITYTDGLWLTLSSCMNFSSIENLDVNNPKSYSNLLEGAWGDIKPESIKGFLNNIIPYLNRYGIRNNLFGLYFPDNVSTIGSKRFYRCFDLGLKVPDSYIDRIYATLENLMDVVWSTEYNLNGSNSAISKSDIFKKEISSFAGREVNPFFGPVSFRISSPDIEDAGLYRSDNSALIEFKNYGLNFRVACSDVGALYENVLTVDDAIQAQLQSIPYYDRDTSLYGIFSKYRVKAMCNVLKFSKLSGFLLNIVQKVCEKYPNIEIGHVELVTTSGIKVNQKSQKGISVCLTPDYSRDNVQQGEYKDFCSGNKIHGGLLVIVDITKSKGVNKLECNTSKGSTLTFKDYQLDFYYLNNED